MGFFKRKKAFVGVSESRDGPFHLSVDQGFQTGAPGAERTDFRIRVELGKDF